MSKCEKPPRREAETSGRNGSWWTAKISAERHVRSLLGWWAAGGTPWQGSGVRRGRRVPGPALPLSAAEASESASGPTRSHTCSRPRSAAPRAAGRGRRSVGERLRKPAGPRHPLEAWVCRREGNGEPQPAIHLAPRCSGHQDATSRSGATGSADLHSQRKLRRASVLSSALSLPPAFPELS